MCASVRDTLRQSPCFLQIVFGGGAVGGGGVGGVKDYFLAQAWGTLHSFFFFLTILLSLIPNVISLLIYSFVHLFVYVSIGSFIS